MSIASVFFQGTFDLESQLLEKSAFVQGLWHYRQGLLNSFQLLVPYQPAPVKGLAAVAVQRISNGLAAVLFELLEFSIPACG